MEKLKFRTRLIIGFSVIIIFSFIIGLVAIKEIYNLSSDAELIYKHPLAVSNSVRDININISGVHRSINEVALAENPRQLDSAFQLVKEHDSLIYLSFSIVQDRFLGDKSTVTSTLITYKDWSAIKDEVYELKKAGKDREALTLFKEKEEQYAALLLEKTKYLTDFSQKKADEFYQNIVNIRKRSILVLLFIISLVLISSILISYFVSNSISDPIHRFISEIKLMYKRDQLQEVNLNNGSEQQILSDTVVELKTVLDKLEQFNSELEDKVEKRTSELAKSEEELKKLNLSLEDKVNERTEELMNSLEREKKSSDLKTQFVSMASHEFRTPLTVINSSASLILKNNKAEQNENRERQISRIKSSVTSLQNILNDFLTLGKIEEGKLEIDRRPTNLKALVGSIVKEASSLTKNGQKINYTHEGLLDVFIDESLMQGVIFNLLSNAIKYSESQIEVISTVMDLNLTITVTDTGIGIPKEDQKMIFGRFYRAENSYNIPGTGLGLNIVQQYVSLLGGTIDFVSEEGVGTTFTVDCAIY